MLFIFLFTGWEVEWNRFYEQPLYFETAVMDIMNIKTHQISRPIEKGNEKASMVQWIMATFWSNNSY